MSYPTNDDRAEWAHTALRAFALQTGQSPVPESAFAWDAEQLEEIAGDLICNLMHLADFTGTDPETLIEQGRGHHEAESGDWEEV